MFAKRLVRARSVQHLGSLGGPENRAAISTFAAIFVVDFDDDDVCVVVVVVVVVVVAHIWPGGQAESWGHEARQEQSGAQEEVLGGSVVPTGGRPRCGR